MVRFFVLLLTLSWTINLVQPNYAKASGVGNVFKTAKEIFLKGSVDGKHLFMVLGVENALDLDKEAIREAVDAEELRNLAATVYNSQHDDDYYDQIRRSTRWGMDISGILLRGAWQDLKDVPGNFAIDIGLARYAYHNASNPVSGAVKFGGRAVWAVAKGAYYLVLQVPVEAVLGVSGPALGAVSGAILQTLELGFKGAWVAIKFTWAAVEVAAITGYSVLTAGLATSGALVVGGTVGVVKGVKFLCFEIPYRLKYPVYSLTDLPKSIDDKDQVAKVALEYLDSTETAHLGALNAVVKTNRKYSTSILVTGTDNSEVGEAQVSARQGKVRVQVSIKRTFVKAFAKSQNLKLGEAKAILKQDAQALVKGIQDSLNVPAEEAKILVESEELDQISEEAS